MSNPIVQANNDLRQITAEIDGSLYRTLAGRKDFINYGIGDEFLITTSASSLQVTVGTGEALICGRTFSITSPLRITLPQSQTLDLCARIDLSQPSGNEGMLYANSVGVLTQEDLNNTGTIYDILLATISTDANGVTSIVDKRVIKDKIYGVETYINIAVQGTPISNAQQSWDTDGDYLYHLDVAVNGITANHMITNFVSPTGLLNRIAPIVETQANKLVIYFDSNASVSSTITLLNAIEVN